MKTVLNVAQGAAGWCLLWLVCLLVGLAALAVIPASVIAGTGRKAWRVAVSFDQLGNTAIGGDEDETFSSRCWRKRDDTPYHCLVPAIDWLFLALSGEKDHCQNAWLDEVAKREQGLKRGAISET